MQENWAIIMLLARHEEMRKMNDNGAIRRAPAEVQAELNGEKEKKERQVNAAGLAWRGKFEQLMEDPRVWYVIANSTEPDGAYGISYRIRRNVTRWVPPGKFQMRSRQNMEGSKVVGSTLYARFIEFANEPILEKGSRGPMQGIDVAASKRPDRHEPAGDPSLAEQPIGLGGTLIPGPPIPIGQPPSAEEWDRINAAIEARRSE
jgi:hypothetical protein